MSTLFDRRFGYTQGRIRPSGVTTTSGDYVFCFGSDVPGEVHRIINNDRIVLTQNADVTGIALIRFQFQARPPESLPTAYIDTVNGAVVTGGLRWIFSWGLNAAIHGRRELAPSRGSLSLFDGAIDCSQFVGNQDIKFTLQAVHP